MKIIPCIYFDDDLDDTDVRFGRAIEVGQIPQIGETIKIKMNLFDHIFMNVHSSYKDKIIFHNAITYGIVKDVVHSFHVIGKEKPRLFSREKIKQEIRSAISSDEQVEIIQTVFVVIEFNNH